jgi:hypothetical protein
MKTCRDPHYHLIVESPAPETVADPDALAQQLHGLQVDGPAILPPLCDNLDVLAELERQDSLVGMRMLFATAVATAVGLGTQPLVAWFGRGDPAAGFLRTALLVGVCATLIFLVGPRSCANPRTNPGTGTGHVPASGRRS